MQRRQNNYKGQMLNDNAKAIGNKNAKTSGRVDAAQSMATTDVKTKLNKKRNITIKQVRQQKERCAHM